ncbi:MAG: HAD-IC family P-type ATPase [Candidatus Harrisonbacteria bacterium]|nr:HAD-IC family P-type ATPase [Candidatus Harrisonbacteria bacterium]
MILKDITKKSFWALRVSDVLDLLETTNEGLTEEEINERLKLFGRNEIPAQGKATKIKIFISQFRSPLIFLLLIAGTITVILKDYNDAIAIFAAALINSILGFYQENKAEEALAHLKSYIEERVRVIRDGRELEIDAREIIPGDIIRVAHGDRIPADARLIYVNDFMVDETILTGEALPVSKTTEPASFHATIGDQKSMIFSGTLVVQGFANAVVCRTGPDTEIGRIAALVKDQKQEETPLQKSIINFSLKASAAILLMASLVFVIGIFTGYSFLDMFLTSVAILVSAIPEGLPIAMTVILAVGVQRLAKKNGIIRKLLAAETLGNTTVILTDKTGTLTEAKMELSKISLFSGEQMADEELVMKLAVVNSDVIIENPKDPHNKWRVIGRPLEVAVVKAAANLEILPVHVKREIKFLDYLPFNSANKFSASVIQHREKFFICLFGAPEILLKISTQVPEDRRRQIAKDIDKMAYGGERVLGIAIKEINPQQKDINLTSRTKFESFKFLATISFTDPIRQGVRDTIHKIDQIGIKTVIVTGDHRGTAESVAKELGFAVHDENVINGPDLDLMSDEELKGRLKKLRVVSRVSPEGKVKIATAYQAIGEIVAMTGDGVNDAPSLKQADIGVAMGSGTDVAKDVAELILLDNNYQTIVSAIEEGRRTMENIRKVIIYLLSDVLDELILIGGSLLLGVAIPLNAIQILWVNIIEDGFTGITLAFEDHADYLIHKPKKLPPQLIDEEMKILIFAIGIPSSSLLFGLYLWLLNSGFDPELIKTFIFSTFGTYSLFLIFSVRSLKKSIWQYSPFSNRYLLAGVSLGLIMMLAAIYLPSLQYFLKTTPLPLPWLAGVIGFGMLNIATIELGKWFIRNKK